MKIGGSFLISKEQLEIVPAPEAALRCGAGLRCPAWFRWCGGCPQPEGFSAVAPVCAEIGSDFFESAPPITKTARMRERAPADRGFPLHRVPFQNKVRSDRFQECWKF